MNPKWKLGALFLLATLAPLWPSSAKRNGAAQEAEPDYKNNNCVSCHSRLLEPLSVVDAVRKQADGAFTKAMKVRDGSRKRIGAE